MADVMAMVTLTLYNEQHFFSPNAINRDSVDTKNKDLKPNPDGSLTIDVQADEPAAESTRQLAAGSGRQDFSLYLRAYWPKVAATDGQGRRQACSP